jgi:hypothetical protein
MVLTWSRAPAPAEGFTVKFVPIASRDLRTPAAELHTDSAHWVLALVVGVCVGWADEAAVGVVVAGGLAPQAVLARSRITVTATARVEREWKRRPRRLSFDVRTKALQVEVGHREQAGTRVHCDSF